MEVFLQVDSYAVPDSGLLHVRGGVSLRCRIAVLVKRSSPRPWRCFLQHDFRKTRECVFSTSVEVFQSSSASSSSSSGLLHVRGGVSQEPFAFQPHPGSSPRPWRCFPDTKKAEGADDVFSTSVEVFLAPGVIRPKSLASSPRPWRCFLNSRNGLKVERVFSTSVEVFLLQSSLLSCLKRLLHVRGGVSIEYTSMLARSQSSPRPWRCFFRHLDLSAATEVFSTSVEVFLAISGAVRLLPLLLHVRGGVSQASRIIGGSSVSSPRPWRCFLSLLSNVNRNGVFSTSVEVFPTSTATASRFWRLLHVRGGVSPGRSRNFVRRVSSPRPWRCFRARARLAHAHAVFSTSVEVFLRTMYEIDSGLSLLHVRGGVSERDARGGTRYTSSPRPWRCFYLAAQAFFSQSVFSTSVEVFPSSRKLTDSARGLLHDRGGVSPAKQFVELSKNVFSTSVEVFSLEKLAGR